MLKRNLILNDKAVSQVVGFMTSFSIVILITGSSIYTVSFLIDQRVEYVSEITGESIVNYVTNTIIECSAAMEICENANYSKTIEVPYKILDRSYYIEASNNFIYLNTTDVSISVSGTTYNQDKLGTNISGKAYGSSGFIKIYNIDDNIYISTNTN